MSRSIPLFGVLILAVGLTAVFWLPLWRGGGFIGGDVYSYYLPQKTFYAERLQQGDWPLWNNRTGFGYPVIAESQTGVFYPPNILLYRFLDVNTAYNVNHLLHYVLAFLFCVLLARALRLGLAASMLTAVVYTCGWFPVRNCLEWAIIGGAWLPAAFWCAERFLQTRLWRYAFGLSGVLALQMISGHYNIGFITQLMLALYVPARLWFAREPVLVPSPTAPRKKVLLLISAAVLAGFALSAVQLLPSWELRQHSQRAAESEHHRLAQGSAPVGYWSQMIVPWKWYAPGVDRNSILQKMAADLDAPTNQVEAHLYVGLIPLGLAIIGVVYAFRERNRVDLLWLLLGLGALFYSSGLLIPFTRHLPGFSYFQGPGRWGIITTLAVALLAGRAWQCGLEKFLRAGWFAGITGLFSVISLASNWTLADDVQAIIEQQRLINPQSKNPLSLAGTELTPTIIIAVAAAAVLLGTLGLWMTQSSRRPARAAIGRATLTGVILFLTALDLWIVSRLVNETQMIDDPPINHLAQSAVKEHLDSETEPVRLFAPYPNFPNVLGVSSLPAYLTFAPASYVDPRYTVPDGPVSERVARLQQLGVTHLLTFQPLSDGKWPVELLWQGFDRVLNPAMGRYGEPLFLYRLDGTRGRAAFAEPAGNQSEVITKLDPERIVIETESAEEGGLVLTELMYPGWKVAVDGRAAAPVKNGTAFRTVLLTPGRHTVVWSWHPRSVYWGAAISLASFLMLAAGAHIRYRHPERLGFLKLEPDTETEQGETDQETSP